MQSFLRKISSLLINHKYSLCIYSGVIIGTLFVNLLNQEKISGLTQENLLDYNYLKTVSSISFDYKMLWQYIASKRLGQSAVLLLCIITPISVIFMLLLALFAGFTIGILISLSVADYGIVGILLVFAILFPQWIFYFLAVNNLIRIRNSESNRTFRMRQIFVIIMFIIIGIGLETLANPSIVRQIAYWLTAF